MTGTVAFEITKISQLNLKRKLLYICYPDSCIKLSIIFEMLTEKCFKTKQKKMLLEKQNTDEYIKKEF